MNKICFTILLMILMSCKPTQVSTEIIQMEYLQDRLYLGYASGINKATVEVLIENHNIKRVNLIKLEATPFGQKAKDSIPIRIVNRQSAVVDAVSGATEASNTIMNATIDALKKAQNK